MKRRYLILLLTACLALGTAACGSGTQAAAEAETETTRNLLLENGDDFIEPLLEKVREENRLAAEVKETEGEEIVQVFEVPENFSKGYEFLDYTDCVSANLAEGLKGTKAAVVGAKVLIYTMPDETGSKYYHTIGVQDEEGNFWKVILNTDGVEDTVVSEAYDYDANGIVVNGTYMGISGRYPLIIADSWFTVCDGVTSYADGIAASRNNVASVFGVKKAETPKESEGAAETSAAQETAKADDKKNESTKATEKSTEESASPEAAEETEEPVASEKFLKSMEEYVEFFEEYVEFMASYDKNDSSQAIRFIDYSSKYAEHMENFDLLGKSGLNSAEEAVYQETKQKIDEILAEMEKSEE